MKKTLMIAPLVMGVVMMGSAQTTNPTTRPTQTDVNRNTTTTSSSTDTRSGSVQGNRADTVPNRTNRPMNSNANRNSGNMGNRRDTMGMRNNGGNNRNMNNTQRNNSVMGDTAGRNNMGNMNSGNMNHSGNMNTATTTDGSMGTTSDMSGGQMNSASRWEAMGMQAGSLPRKDLKFVALAASSNGLELKASQLALQQASSAAVKDYANMMIQHHTQAATEMKSMLTSKGAMLPDSFMLDRHRSRVEALAGLQGTDFDRAYVRLMVDAHEEDVDEFEDETTDARDADLRAFATKMMPTLRMHYSRAKELRKSMR